uniref:Uncharacterized protein n=1 Tax=Plectus sambesii TaxID=2011161 RepID=A0A914VLM5_9BILA
MRLAAVRIRSEECVGANDTRSKHDNSVGAATDQLGGMSQQRLRQTAATAPALKPVDAHNVGVYHGDQHEAKAGISLSLTATSSVARLALNVTACVDNVFGGQHGLT